MAELRDFMKHITVKLRTVQRRDAADAFGVGEFYVAGGAGTGPLSWSKSTAVLTHPIYVDTGQTKTFAAAEAVVFDGNVRADDFVELGLEFRDRDLEDLDFDAKYAALRSSLSSAVGTVVGNLVVPGVGTIAGAILVSTGPALARVLTNIDKDGVLGTVQKRINVSAAREGRNGPYTWRFSRFWPNVVEEVAADTRRWVDWEYTVTYVVDVTLAR